MYNLAECFSCRFTFSHARDLFRNLWFFNVIPGAVLSLLGIYLKLKKNGTDLNEIPGRIINITSVHGKLAVNRYSNYAVAKHALETISDSLRLEMKKFGVHVAIVEPGMFAAGTSVLSQATASLYTC